MDHYKLMFHVLFSSLYLNYWLVFHLYCFDFLSPAFPLVSFRSPHPLSHCVFIVSLLLAQYLFEKGRIENIFTDELYNLFATEITSMLQHWKPKLLPSGTVTNIHLSGCLSASYIL